MHRECRERFPRHRLQRKPLVSDSGMHHGTCVTYVPWCMLGSLTRGGGENDPGIPGACATQNFTYLARGPLFAANLNIPGYFPDDVCYMHRLGCLFGGSLSLTKLRCFTFDPAVLFLFKAFVFSYAFACLHTNKLQVMMNELVMLFFGEHRITLTGEIRLYRNILEDQQHPSMWCTYIYYTMMTGWYASLE